MTCLCLNGGGEPSSSIQSDGESYFIRLELLEGDLTLSSVVSSIHSIGFHTLVGSFCIFLLNLIIAILDTEMQTWDDATRLVGDFPEILLPLLSQIEINLFTSSINTAICHQ